MDKILSKLEQQRANAAALRKRKNNPFEDAARGRDPVKPRNTPEASGTARKAPSGSLLGEPSRNSVRASIPSPKSKGGRPLAKDADKALMRTKPWIAEGMSRASWYRRLKAK
jgi:hypothetical protein